MGLREACEPQPRWGQERERRSTRGAGGGNDGRIWPEAGLPQALKCLIRFAVSVNKNISKLAWSSGPYEMAVTAEVS